MKRLTAIALALALATSAAAWTDSNTNQGRPNESIDGGTATAPIKRYQFRRDTDVKRRAMTPRAGEPFWATDTEALYVGDGTTAGGIPIGGGATYASFNVMDSGAECDGTTDDTAAFVATEALAAAAGGGVIELPAGKTCVVKQTDDQVAPVTLTGSNQTWECNGATIKATSSNQPDNATEEGNFAFAFRAVGRSNIHFRNCNFDGNRNAATDPRMGFVMLVQTSDSSVVGGVMGNSTNVTGVVAGTGYKCVMSGSSCGGSSTNACYGGIRVSGVTIEKSGTGIHFLEGVQGLDISKNNLRLMDIAAYVSSPTDYGWSYTDPYGGGGYRIIRGIRQTGFTKTPVCDIKGVRVAGNRVQAAFAFEFWNNDSTHGRDTTKAYDYAVTGNVFEAFGGLSLNGVGSATVTGNTFHRLKMDSTETAAYTTAGGNVHGLASTASGTSGWGMELSPMADFTVTGNTVDCDGEGSLGISSGSGQFANSGLISENLVDGCTYGIRLFDSQDLVVADNRIKDCSNAIRVDPAHLGYINETADGTGNVLIGNRVKHTGSAANTQSAVVFVDSAVTVCTSDHTDACTTNSDCTGGDTCDTVRDSQEWEIQDLQVRAKADASSVVPALSLLNGAMTVTATGLRMRGFKSYAIHDAALTSTYDNVFGRSLVALGAGQTPHLWRFDQQANKSVSIGTATCLGCDVIAGWYDTNVGPSGQSYSLGTWNGDSTLQSTPMLSPNGYGGTGSIPTVGDVRVLVGGRSEIWNGATRKAGIYHNAGTCESVVTASPGSICQDDTTGTIEHKLSGTSNTGWSPLQRYGRTSATLVSDALTVTAAISFYDVAGEGAANDVLNAISGGSVTGQRVCLRAASSTVDIAVTASATLDLNSAGTFTLDHADDLICLMYDATLGRWLEVSRSDNAS